MTQHAWQRYEGETRNDGLIDVFCQTNDNNDDGYPDGSTAEWSHHGLTRPQFDKICGKSRVGISGIIVTVTLDGQEVR